MFQAFTLDDAGQRVPLVYFNMTLLPFSVGPLPREVQHAMRAAAMSEGWHPRIYLSRQAWFRGGLIGFIPPAFMIGTLEVIKQFGTQSIFGRNQLLILFLVYVVMFYVIFKIMPLALTDQIRSPCARVTVSSGYCGSCGYTLPESPNTDNGLCCCSECGAAWTRSNQRDA